jgi:predicted DNA-binding protein
LEEFMRRRKIRQINLRLGEPLRRRLETAAAEREISTNQLMRELLEAGLDNLENKDANIAETIAKAVAKQLGFSKVPRRPRPPRTFIGSISSQQHKKEGGDA